MQLDFLDNDCPEWSLSMWVRIPTHYLKNPYNCKF